MKARLYKPEDAARLDELLDQNRRGDVRLDRDLIGVAGLNGKADAVIVGRPVVFVHELQGDRSVHGLRHLLETLLNYSFGFLKAAGHREALFIVDQDNERMHRFMQENGAVRERDGVIYSLVIE